MSRARCRGARWTAPSSSRWPCRADKPAAGAPGAEGAPAAVDASAKIRPAPDLIAPATHAAAEALGWKSPETGARQQPAAPRRRPPVRRSRARRRWARDRRRCPLAVAIKLPPLPPYHGPKMDLRAEIDRGDVVLERPKLDKDGKKKWKPPVADRPTLTLYAKAGDHEVALVPLADHHRRLEDVREEGRHHGAQVQGVRHGRRRCGPRFWPRRPGTRRRACPPRSCSSSAATRFEPKTEIIGPGYRAAYGLVAIAHHQIMERNEKGEPQLMDLRIRTHGTPGYRAVKRGESNGCHRLHNFEALRLSAFLVKHHEHVRDGLVPEDYVRKLDLQGPGSRAREREQGLPLQADAARAGDRPRQATSRATPRPSSAWCRWPRCRRRLLELAQCPRRGG